jgi:SNF2 family DNA or RNA helicase
MQLPEALKPFIQSAEEVISQGLIGEIEFSGGTYQVQVLEPASKKEAWAFLQLNNAGELKDYFCSCGESEDVSACVHVVAAYLALYNQHSQPLHRRFEQSLWNKLCFLCADRLGDDPSVLKTIGQGQYIHRSVGGKVIVQFTSKTVAGHTQLREVIEERPRETEETSLKFSNLSQEEILLWKEGRPSPQLSYELSFWNDLAKWLMLMQERGEKYEISFEESANKFPNFIEIRFRKVVCGFYLAEANLPLIIPSLATVKSPLVVHNMAQELVEKITYDKSEGALLLKTKAQSLEAPLMPKEGLQIGHWIFVPKDGFYQRDPQGLLSQSVITSEKIPQALNQHTKFIKERLVGTLLHDIPIKPSYTVSFDAEWNLHIKSYLFKIGDLSTPFSRGFEEWVYLENDGFYRLDDARFQRIETIILSDDVADFVHRNRAWLNTQEGFGTHVSSIEAQLTYELTDKNTLIFSRRIALESFSTTTKDFGSWIYIAGEGFYSKVSSPLGLPLRPGVSLHAEQIPLFIRMNKAELQLVPGFFSEVSPVVKSGLQIGLTKNELVQITPIYDLRPEYFEKEIKFFEDYVHVKGEGFHELPIDSRLPEPYRRPTLIDPENVPLFLTYELEKLKPYAISIDPRLVKAEKMQLCANSIARDEGLGKGWYILKLFYGNEKGKSSISEIWTALKKKKRFLFSEVGLIDLESKKFDWLRLLAKDRLDRRSNTLLLSTMELIRLNAFDEIVVKESSESPYQQSLELLHELTEFRIPDEPEVKGLASTLRSYQQLGLRWLWFLYHHTLSGLLCDDMGLGKTHQAMALLASTMNEHKKRGNLSRRHFLVICPTSVIYHWQEKLQAFLPGVRVCTFHGINRSLGDFQKDYDILLTSYGVWRNEVELLSQVSFEIAIFDEIQIAKNHSSRIHQSLLKVNAQMRLGLTGTPIENHLRELKSLFDLVLPHYMPGENDYREYFIKPIEKEQDGERRELLTRFIKPFILRRKKAQVLTDLPEKTEEVFHCVLSPDQEKLYVEVLELSRQRIMQDLANENHAIPYVHIFTLLMHLKQICNHPAVYLKQPEKYKEFQSGKWELFLELLNEARESGQKVVVFTQYIAMLDIFELYLQEHGIKYAMIKGATQDRGEQLRRFNQDPRCEVFLGSLQAAGLGIDLTAASVVIHYDRWWNAARENQATDRVHRIGQTRGVQVFKLVNKGTFEEKIDQLITKKGKLMEEVVGVDDHRIVKIFERKEIIELLQYSRPSN